MSKPNFTILNVELPKDKYNLKAPYAMQPVGVTIHETDNNAPARNEIAYMQRNNNQVSFHFAVDEKEIIQGVPLNRNTWNAGDYQGKGNRRTIAIEICRNYRTDDLTNYYKARENAEELVGWLLHLYGWGAGDIYTHNDHSGKNCPRVIRKEGYLDTFKRKAVAHRDGYNKPPTVAPKPTDKKKTDREIAQEVINGKWGNGANRKTELRKAGYDYDKVQVEVNNILYGRPAVKPTPKPQPKPKPVVKTDKELAQEVIDGKHGTGDARKKALGNRYTAVQAEVNKILSGTASTKPKRLTNKEVAYEIVFGKNKWGNGRDRVRNLQRDGYNYEAVQREINRLV